MKPPTPLYYKIAEDLREGIIRGDWKHEQNLPTEKELIKMFNVSRLTVREAIKSLVAQGFVEKKQGLGMFIAKSKADHIVGLFFLHYHLLVRNVFLFILEVGTI